MGTVHHRSRFKLQLSFFMKYFHHEKCQNIFDFFNNFGFDGCSDSTIVVGSKFFQGSLSFNQQFNNVEQRQQQQVQVPPSLPSKNHNIVQNLPRFQQRVIETQNKIDVETNSISDQITPEDHAAALERHQIHKQQLAEVVEQHKSLVGQKEQQIIQKAEKEPQHEIKSIQEPIQEKLFRVDKEESAHENVVLDNREENIALNEIPDVESKEPLTELQREIIDNLELIGKLVKEVHQLEEMVLRRN